MADPAKQQQPTQEQIVEEDEFEEFAVEGELIRRCSFLRGRAEGGAAAPSWRRLQARAALTECPLANAAPTVPFALLLACDRIWPCAAILQALKR